VKSRSACSRLARSDARSAPAARQLIRSATLAASTATPCTLAQNHGNRASPEEKTSSGASVPISPCCITT
jgi:hypothetical protein